MYKTATTLLITLAGYVQVGLLGTDDNSALPSFEVAAVKPSSHPLTPEGYSISDQKIVAPGRFRAVNSNLDECLRWAYDVQEYEVVEPAWFKSSSITFDIDASAPSDTSPAAMRLMLRRLLADRFDLAVHREVKKISVYRLIVDKGRPNLQRAAVDSPKAITLGHGSLTSSGTTMPRLAGALAREIDCPVLDRTNLSGLFAMDLKYAPPDAVENGDSPSIFRAITELGLRLQPARDEIKVWKVDHANQKPTAN